MLKKTIIVILLSVIFAVISAAIISALLTEIEFSLAKKLVSSFKWAEAEAAYRRAIKLNPFEARHFSGYGDFMLTQNRYRDNKLPLVRNAVDMYKRAIKLVPDSADYKVRLGVARVRETTLTGATDVSSVMNYLKQAVKNDPNGGPAAYAAGYAAIPLWRRLSDDDRKFALDRLRYSITVNPQIGVYIYPRLWRYTRDFNLLKEITPDTPKAQEYLYDFLAFNNLWQFRKSLPEKNRVRVNIAEVKRIAPSGWRGSSEDGKHLYADGNMYWSGTIYTVIDIPPGKSVISVQAKGTPVAGIYPYMILELDGEEIGGTFVDTVEYKDYDFTAATSGGPKVLSVSFLNDYCAKGEDRNLHIGAAKASAA